MTPENEKRFQAVKSVILQMNFVEVNGLLWQLIGATEARLNNGDNSLLTAFETQLETKLKEGKKPT